MRAQPAESRGAATLVIACGALVPEIQAVLRQGGLSDIDVRALPASFHNRPERIVPGLRRLVTAARPRYAQIFIAYADCGTGGQLDDYLTAEGLARLPGAHCYAFYSGVEAFERRPESDIAAFYLTDFLARHFDTLVWKGLGMDRHPELKSAYFGNYRSVVYLSQASTPDLIARARAAADKLGLAFEHRPTGYGDLKTALEGLRHR